MPVDMGVVSMPVEGLVDMVLSDMVLSDVGNSLVAMLVGMLPVSLAVPVEGLVDSVVLFETGIMPVPVDKGIGMPVEGMIDSDVLFNIGNIPVPIEVGMLPVPLAMPVDKSIGMPVEGTMDSVVLFNIGNMPVSVEVGMLPVPLAVPVLPESVLMLIEEEPLWAIEPEATAKATRATFMLEYMIGDLGGEGGP
jgi:hypothetical protein